MTLVTCLQPVTQCVQEMQLLSLDKPPTLGVNCTKDVKDTLWTLQSISAGWCHSLLVLLLLLPLLLPPKPCGQPLFLWPY